MSETPMKGNDSHAKPGSDTSFQMYIDGEWVDSSSNETFTTIDPSTGEELGTVPEGTRDDVQRAIDAAQGVQKDLEFMSEFERADLCHEIADAIESQREWLGEWVARDQGKPLESEALPEVDQIVRKFRDAAEEVKRMEPPTIPSEDPNKRIFTMRKPHGVYGAITPWNFPIGIPCEYLAPGLAGGNALVWVPAPTTSAVATKLVEILDDTSLPDGAINLVTGKGEVVGDELVANEGTDAIAFTGSAETGEIVAERAGSKPVLLELGGNGPMIVLDDAEIDRAVEAASLGCFLNAGQTCTATERIIVHDDVHDEFVERLTDAADSITTGSPTESSTEMGPLNNEEVAAKVDQHLEDAVDQGAKVRTGGNRLQGAGSRLHYAPTVVDEVTKDMDLNTKETFGPVAPIITFSDYDEAIELANESRFGLNSAVFTSNIKSMYYFAERIETGTTLINEANVFWEIHTPLGGYTGKDSGHGREGGRHTLEEMTQLKTVYVDIDGAKSSH